MTFSHAPQEPVTTTAPDSWTVRTIDEAEIPAFRQVASEALNIPLARQRIPLSQELIDSGRALAADLDGHIVGTTVAHPFTMTLPGGPRPVAGVSAVGVSPTHRRRGALSALMRRQLADLRSGNEAVAALFASEGGIYRRFGYGPASRAGRVVVRVREAALRRDVPRDPGLRIRLCDPEDVREQLGSVHRAAALERVGEFQRDGHWWDKVLSDSQDQQDGCTGLRCALVEGDQGPQGYALYRVKQQWDEHWVADSRLWLREVYATTPAARALLWEHVLTRDLVSTVTADSLARDDALYWLLSDPHQARTTVSHGLWVRLVDVRRALEQRSYAAPVDMTLEVTDATCPENAGRWHLSAGPDGAHCASTDRGADLSVDVAELGAAYLGDVRLGSHRAAGLLTEHTDGAVERLDTALSRSADAHCRLVF
ncbi:putative acetyltransferase [Haloactinospora alba]|uniref:Putative acetyltransferase n=1 Tax=Haloactinospora alba TaxID=405555 RepID=A0A543NKI1_9ACTN|nr:GNAT family N-acetyltransferase [Haloactinospora alba]TQN32375.1 putative acetyltransferase [Haloactinospora alba]